MSSISQENSQSHNTENNLVTKHHLDTVDRESDSDNGIFDNSIAVNQSDHSSSVGGTNEHDQSDESDESDEELLNDSNKKRLLYRNMFLYFGREFIVFLILLLTTYATYHNM